MGESQRTWRKLAVLSDVHANLEALSAVLTACAAEEVDAIVVCGDWVGYGPSPNECVTALREANAVGVRGNHDAVALKEAEARLLDLAGQRAIRWTQRKLHENVRAHLQDLPVTLRRSAGIPIELEVEVEVVHGSPTDPLWGRIQRRRDAYLAFRLLNASVSLLLFGHTHVPAIFTLEDDETVYRRRVRGNETIPLDAKKRHLLNPGSVGQPRDGDWRACFCILERPRTTELIAHFRRIEYPVEETRQKMEAARLPLELANRLLSGT